MSVILCLQFSIQTAELLALKSHLSHSVQDFPYNFEKGVMHHNLWAQSPLSDEQIVKVRQLIATLLSIIGA